MLLTAKQISANIELYSESAERGIFMYINRGVEKIVFKMLKMFKVILVTGPRQVGKTTMLKYMLGNDYSYVTLDDINELELAKSDAGLFFLNHPGKIIIDEVQNAPELFLEIKRIVDASEEYGKIILTGSQTFSLMSNVDETLAGRVGIIEMNGLSLREITGSGFEKPVMATEEYLNRKDEAVSAEELWNTIHRGDLPELYRNELADWNLYYSSYIKTYIERDVRMLINVRDLASFSRFIIALAARTSQLLNYNAIANELGVDMQTVKRWIGILEISGIIVLIQPFSNNQLSRVIKTPMIYFMNTGLVCHLLKWNTPEVLMNGAMSGAILETYVVSEIIKSFKNAGTINVPVYFYRDKDMKEIDVIIEDAGILYPIEIKKATMPKATMIKNAALLEKAKGYTVGNKMIMCLVGKKIYLAKDVVAYPIAQI